MPAAGWSGDSVYLVNTNSEKTANNLGKQVGLQSVVVAEKRSENLATSQLKAGLTNMLSHAPVH